jgi:hypothetical protein
MRADSAYTWARSYKVSRFEVWITTRREAEPHVHLLIGKMFQTPVVTRSPDEGLAWSKTHVCERRFR